MGRPTVHHELSFLKRKPSQREKANIERIANRQIKVMGRLNKKLVLLDLGKTSEVSLLIDLRIKIELAAVNEHL
jgi:hypothetical protein